MKMIFALMMISGLAQAATKSEVWNLTQQVQDELRFHNQSPEQLGKAQAALLEALAALRGEGGEDPQACIDFALERYKADGYSNSTALQKSGEWCRGVAAKGGNLEVLAFFFSHLREDGYSNATSMQKALELGGNIKLNQLACVERAYATYRGDGYSNATSLQKSAAFCAQ